MLAKQRKHLKMHSLSSFVQLLPILASGVLGSARLPDKPADLSTPVQQRIAINGPDSAYNSQTLFMRTSHTD